MYAVYAAVPEMPFIFVGSLASPSLTDLLARSFARNSMKGKQQCKVRTEHIPIHEFYQVLFIGRYIPGLHDESELACESYYGVGAV